MNLAFQQKLKLERQLPSGLEISLGSQWWCLHWETCKAILDYDAAHPDIRRFFENTWIPDESYFQTIIRQVVPIERIQGHSLTYYQFSDYGKPYVYFNEHEAFLRRQSYFFCRKVAASARMLRQNLHKVGRSDELVNVVPPRSGAVSSEMDAMRSLGRAPAQGRRSIGTHYDMELCDLPFSGRNVLLQLWPIDIYTYSGLAPPAGIPGESVVHGHLFNRDLIHFAGSKEIFGGYAASDISVRNSAPARFLANIVGAGPDLTVFSATWNEGTQLALDMLKLKYGSIVLIDSLSTSALVTIQMRNRFGAEWNQKYSDAEAVRLCHQDVISAQHSLNRIRQLASGSQTLRTLNEAAELVIGPSAESEERSAILGRALDRLTDHVEQMHKIIEDSALSRSIRMLLDPDIAGGRKAPLEVGSPAPDAGSM